MFLLSTDLHLLILFQLAAFSLPSVHTINSLTEEMSEYEYGSAAYASYLSELQKFGKEVDARNAELEEDGKFPYVYMHPDNCPTSIDI